MDEKEETSITVSSFITHPSYFLNSLRVFLNYGYTLIKLVIIR